MTQFLSRILLPALMLLALCASMGRAASSYEVGNGFPYPSLGSVPWDSLKAGDIVRIHWRPEPYREKLKITCSGTADAPIQIVGVPGPNGQRPVIDGQNATTAPNSRFRYAPTQDRGVCILTQEWGQKPRHLVFSTLEFRNAHADYSFTDADGQTRSYTYNAAGFFVERGEHIVVRNCTIDGNGNGFFVASGGSEELMSRDIRLEGCSIYNNGNVGRDREHNVYTEAVGMVMQNNFFGRPRSGALGNNVKDRSAGTVIRYNWIEGGAHALDLVEAQESYRTTTIDPCYRKTFVYGNLILNAPGDGGWIVHYGGDNGDTGIYRKGTLFFYNNTVVIRCNQSGTGGRWRTVVFQLETNDERVDARNNIFFGAAATAGSASTELTFFNTAGIGDFKTNWVSPGWVLARSGVPFTGSVTGTQNFRSNPENRPGFMDLAGLQLSLAADSPCLDAADSLPDDAFTYPVDRQYLAPAGWEERPVVGGRDLGALEGVQVLQYSVQGCVSAGGTPLADVNVRAGNLVTRTGSTGEYLLTGLPAGAYTVTGEREGYQVSAAAVSVGPNQAGVNLTAKMLTYTISGNVSVGGVRLSGVTVTAGGVSALTGTDGTYRLTGLPAGSYSVSAARLGYTLSAAQGVTVGPDRAGINFTATEVPTYVLQASPTVVEPGGTLTLSWTAPAGRPSTDWIAFYPSNATSLSGYLAWTYTSGKSNGTWQVRAPNSGGSYLFRYFKQNTTDTAAVSNQVKVDVNDLPTVSITSPANGATFTPGAATPITAAAADADGIARVEFLVDGVKVGERTSAPYSLAWTPTASKASVLTARAYDVRGGVTTSAPVTVYSGVFAVTSETSQVRAGVPFETSWSAPGGRPARDWVALVKANQMVAGTPNRISGYVKWTYTGGASTGKFAASVPAGQEGTYYFCYLLDDGTAVAAQSAPVKVVP